MLFAVCCEVDIHVLAEAMSTEILVTGTISVQQSEQGADRILAEFINLINTDCDVSITDY